MLSWASASSSQPPSHAVKATGAPHVDTALRYVGVREKTGRNDGRFVEMFLRSVGLKKGNPWCAAFISYCLERAKAVLPKVRSGLARRFVTKESIRAEDVLSGRYYVRRGDLLVWFNGNTINGHIETASENWPRIRDGPREVTAKGTSIGGNTNKKGSREGDGVYEQVRQIKRYDYHRIRYITPVTYE